MEYDELKEILKRDWNKPTPLFQLLDNDKPFANIICRIGKWAISTEGDIAYLYRDDNMVKTPKGYLGTYDTYDIYNERLNEPDWILHLTGKDWFTEEVFEDFKRAYFIACKIAGVKPTIQNKTY